MGAVVVGSLMMPFRAVAVRFRGSVMMIISQTVRCLRSIAKCQGCGRHEHADAVKQGEDQGRPDSQHLGKSYQHATNLSRSDKSHDTLGG